VVPHHENYADNSVFLPSGPPPFQLMARRTLSLVPPRSEVLPLMKTGMF